LVQPRRVRPDQYAPARLGTPLSPEGAWRHVEAWLACDPVWIPGPTERHAETLGGFVVSYQLRGNLGRRRAPHLAALASEHGLTVFSADTDVARFREIRWVNPLVTP